jgi:predicted Zn-dependent protease
VQTTRDVSDFFFNLGRRLGRAAVPALRKGKWIWEGLTGSEEEALQAERALGRTLAGELRAVTIPTADPTSPRLVQEVGARLQGALADRRRQFRCEVIADAVANAVALPGGFLFISDALVDLCERRPDELAFVLGHEMAHVFRGHAWDRLLSQTAWRAVSVITLRAGRLGYWLRHQGLPLLRSAHARRCELEADEAGLRLAGAAGFDPAAALTWLQRIEQVQATAAALGEYLTSHPPPKQRLTWLEPICKELTTGASLSPGQ